MLGASGTELRELGIAWFAVSLAFTIGAFGPSLLGLAFSFLSIGLAFVLHELAHKLVAQSYGCWAEFRMDAVMLILMVLLAFGGVIFAAPGAVVILGAVTRDQRGRISLAGPLANLALAWLFLPLALLGEGLLSLLSGLCARINSWVALFNLIPFGPLDGSKVLAWSKGAYAGVLVVAVPTFFATTAV